MCYNGPLTNPTHSRAAMGTSREQPLGKGHFCLFGTRDKRMLEAAGKSKDKRRNPKHGFRGAGGNRPGRPGVGEKA